jgi:3-hydroxyisobutyrate dehydrogenase
MRRRATGKGLIIKIGFIGLGNVGGKLAASLLRNNFDLTVRDLDHDLAAPLLKDGAAWAETPAAMAAKSRAFILAGASRVISHTALVSSTLMASLIV